MTLNNQRLPLDQICLCDDLQLRDGLNEEAIREYADRLAAKAPFPPLIIVSDGTQHLLVDGYHRFHAARRAGLTELNCLVRAGSKEDAEWLACSVNAKHGLRRSNSEKRRAIERALAHPNSASLTVREIAAHVGVHFTTVAQYRRAGRTDSVGNLQESAAQAESMTLEESRSEREEPNVGETARLRNDEAASFALSEFADNRAAQSEASSQQAAVALQEDVDRLSAPDAAAAPLSPTKPSRTLAKTTRSATNEITQKLAYTQIRNRVCKDLDRCEQELLRDCYAPINPARRERCLKMLKDLQSEFWSYFEEYIVKCEDEEDPFIPF